MARGQRRKGNTELAQELLEWATSQQVAEDPYVRQLADALASGDQLDYWSRYDNLEMLPAGRSTVGTKEARLSDALINFRNIMVFVPVAFTWAGISQATSAFSEYASINTNKVVNFFDFWENGYGVLSDFWTLSNVAQIDFLLLTIIIFASTAIAILQARVKKIVALAEKFSDRQRVELGLRINYYLHEFRAPTPEIVNQRVAQSVSNLRKSTSDLAKTSKSLERGSSALSKGSPVLTQVLAIKKLLGKKDK